MKIVITGTSRGIGLELTRRALEEGHEVLAVARSPEESSELMAFKKEFPTLKTLKLDILDKNSLDTLAEGLKEWPVVDVLINNAGIYREDEKREDYEMSFLTNAIMPLLITKSLLPKLKESKRPVALEITSQMGSIADNSSGGSYSYRASKAAMNMLFKSLSVDEKWLTTLLVHPGWVQTRMGGERAPTTPRESAKGIWNLIDKAHPSQSGSFLTFRGESLPW